MSDPVSIALLCIAATSLIVSLSSPIIIATAFVIRERITHSACMDCNNNEDEERHHHHKKEKDKKEKILENDKNK